MLYSTTVTNCVCVFCLLTHWRCVRCRLTPQHPCHAVRLGQKKKYCLVRNWKCFFICLREVLTERAGAAGGCRDEFKNVCTTNNGPAVFIQVKFL